MGTALRSVPALRQLIFRQQLPPARPLPQARKRALASLAAKGPDTERRSCIPRAFSSASAGPGLFAIPGLHEPADFLRLAMAAADRCNSYRSLLDSSLATGTAAPDPASAVDTLRVLDGISNEVCSVIDAAELCRCVHSDPRWRDGADGAFGMLSDYIAELNGDDTLYRALVEVTSSSFFGDLSEEERRVARLLQHEFERDGIHLPPEERERVRSVIGHITQLEGLFTKNITAGRKLFDLPSAAVERVIPKATMAEHVPQSDASLGFGSTVVTASSDAHIANSLIKYSSDPELRRAVHMEVNTACPENLNVLDGLVERRHELATMLGFGSYAERFLQDKMAQDPATVQGFLDQMGRACKRSFGKEMEMLTQAKTQIEGGGEIEAWDIPFYTGVLKARQSGEAGDVNDAGGYFTVDNSLKGMQVLVERLFGIEMVETEMLAEERWDGPSSSHPVRKFQMEHPDEGSLGTLYMDLHPRDGKYGHAAHFTVKCGCKTKDSDSYQQPIVALVCNLSPAYSKVGSTALLSHSEVETLMHEFGHALHSLLSRTTFQHLSGTRAAMDFIETPSHLLESFVWDPTFLRIIGQHHLTGAIISDSMISSLLKSRHSFRGIDIQTQIIYARFDQELFATPPSNSTAAIFDGLHKAYGVPYAEGTHWYSRFGHLVTYGAGYYGYLYSQVFAADIWQNNFARNPLSLTEGGMLWKGLLRHGGARDPISMMKTVLGREPKVDSFFDSLE